MKRAIFLIIKRLFDIVFSFICLVFFSLLMGIVAIVIFIEEPGHVIFKQKRIGKGKKVFYIYKFRSMKNKTPHDVPTHLLKEPDKYLLKTGKFLRKTSIDELPQLWNIFLGQMSFIGPRPVICNLTDWIEERDKYGANDIKPGLTGWAQVNGRDELETMEKAKLDGEYVQKQSLLFDAKCFFLTIPYVFKHKGVVEGGTGELKRGEGSV